MNFNLFAIIAASAVSATVALPAQATERVAEEKFQAATDTQNYLQRSANFYPALDHNAQL